MVLCDNIGRLGNNLFQVACAAGYASKHGMDFNIPPWEYSKYFPRVQAHQDTQKGHATDPIHWGEKGFAYQDIPFIPDVKLFGYFQSEKYFKHCEDKVRDLFEFSDQIKSQVNAKYVQSTNPDFKACSIHVRRGDYIGNHFHEVCHLEYYLDAIKEIKSRSAVDLFLVFSDDIPWCKENLRGENFLFVEGNSNIEDLYLMTQCRHNIICNSSFSWWGAWLNANKEKIIIAPGKWFNDPNWDTKDLIPESWIKIKM